MKKIILLFLGCMMSVLIHAQAAYDFVVTNSDGLRIYYKITDATNHYVEVTNGDGGVKNPPMVDPYKDQLTALNLHVFRVPATVVNGGVTYQVKGIGKSGMFALGSDNQGYEIVLPEGLTTIGEGAFSVSYTLRKINFPSTLTSIGQNAFFAAGSWGLYRTPAFHQTYDMSQTKITELDNVFGLQWSVEKIVYPETLKTLKGSSVCGADAQSDRLLSITIPAAVETVGQFGGPQNLNTIYMHPFVAPAFDQGASGNLGIKSTATIYVPVDATHNYETATGAATPWTAYVGQYREQLNIGATGYITYYLENENFKVPTGCTAYIITGVTPSGSVTTPDQAVVKAFTAGKIIPKQTGFVLQGPANSTVIYEANVTGTEESVAGNLLIGTATEQQFSATGKRFYILANGDQGMGFYKQGTRYGMSIKLKAHRAGLRLDESVARAKSIVFDFDTARQEAETTGIQNVPTNGKQQDDVVYDLQGRRVTNPTHGIYIINGKKVIK